jgi:hypothetical protein
MATRTPLPVRTSSSYPAALCRWVISNAKANPGIWIFVLDGFGQPGVRQEVTEMIQLLAQQVMTPEVAKTIRLVLLHYDQSLSGNWRPKTLDDGPLPGGPITKEELIECLVEFNKLMAKRGEVGRMIEQTAINPVVDQMLADSGNGSQLQSLYNQLIALASR